MISKDSTGALHYKYLHHLYLFVGIGYVTFRNNYIVRVSQVYKVYPFILCILSVLVHGYLLYMLAEIYTKLSEVIVVFLSVLKLVSLVLSGITSWILRMKAKINVSFEMIKNFDEIDKHLQINVINNTSVETVIWIHITIFLLNLLHISNNFIVCYLYCDHSAIIYVGTTISMCFVSQTVILRYVTNIYLISGRLLVLINQIKELFKDVDHIKTSRENKRKAVEAFITAYMKLLENIELAVSEFGIPVKTNFKQNSILLRNLKTLLIQFL